MGVTEIVSVLNEAEAYFEKNIDNSVYRRDRNDFAISRRACATFGAAARRKWPEVKRSRPRRHLYEVPARIYKYARTLFG